MDWTTLFAGMRLNDPDMPVRAGRILGLLRVINGEQYDHLGHDFSEEKNASNEYIPLRQRRPSVRTNLPRVVVDDVVSLLFGDGHFPTVLALAEPTRAALAGLVADRSLNQLMMQAATLGSVGSACIRLRVLKNKPHFDVLSTAFLTPEWREDDPDTLLRVTEKYKVPAARLIELGYSVKPEDGDHWFQRFWDDTTETWFNPWPVSKKDAKPTIDKARTVTHGLGFVPMVWVRNLPGGDDIDGDSTFNRAIDTVIELDYLLSQSGRGLKYSSDPTLVLKTGSEPEGSKEGGSASALIVPPEGDAKLLEINGSAAGAVLNHAQELRTIALELMKGNRAHPDKMTAAQSGRAMELLNQALVWLAGKLRIAYGEGALKSLLRMVCDASQAVKGGLLIEGKSATLDATGLQLKWPDWYPPTADDRFAEVNALNAGIVGGIVSRETAVQTAMEFYKIDDYQAELARIKTDMADADARAKQQAADEAAARPKPLSAPAK
jgi:hypothetical protein